MFTSIKTSKQNKDVVSLLTRRLNLGAENVIARIAFTYSLSKDKKMDLSKIADSQGKEYSAKVLFGDHLDFYVALVCVQYNLYKSHKDIGKYVKMHIDEGLTMISNEIDQNPNITGSEFLISKIERGLKAFQ